MAFIEDIQITALINEVKLNRILYDKSFSGYKNSLLKQNTWVAVANILGRPVEDIQKQFKGLRDRFTREYRTHELATRSGAGASKPPSWKHFEELTFLIGHVKFRKTLGNYAPPTSPTPPEEVEAIETLDDEEEQAPNDPRNEPTFEEYLAQEIDAGASPSTSSEQTAPKRKRKRMVNSDTDDKVGSILDKVFTELDKIGNRPQEKYSEFATLLAHKMEKLPNDIALGLELEFMSRVNLLLQEMERGFVVD